MADVHLIIVTDDPRQAALDVLGVATLLDVPSFVQILSEPEQISRIPDGARCIGRWYRAHRSMAEFAWIDRKAMGGTVGISSAFQDRLNEWKDKRRAAEAELLREILTGEGTPAPHVAAAAISQPETRQPKQRWS